MFTSISSHDLDVALTDFADQVKEKLYKKFPYDKWKEFISKFKGKCISMELICDDLEITSNDKKMMILDIYDESLGEFLFTEFLEEVCYDERGYCWYDKPDEKAFGRDVWEMKCKVASSETNKNGTRIDPDALLCSTQSTSSNCYPVKNYKLDLSCMDELSKSAQEAANAVDKLKNVINEKEKNDMKGFNFDFGPCTNDNVRMSMYGLAIQNNAGVWVSYNNGQVIDVDIMNFDGRQYMFKMPVAIKDIKVGDVVVHNRVPMFVTSVEGGVHVVDIRAGEAKTIVPTTNMFGFNFITKIVSMFDAFGTAPTADQPFGNMLPFMLMGEGKDIDPMMMFMMMNSGNGTFDMSNPMMLYFMFGKDGSKSNDMLPFMMMMNMQNANGKHTPCNCGGHNDN